MVFSESVSGFSAADVDLSASTAGGTLVPVVSGSGENYTVSVSGMILLYAIALVSWFACYAVFNRLKVRVAEEL